MKVEAERSTNSVFFPLYLLCGLSHNMLVNAAPKSYAPRPKKGGVGGGGESTQSMNVWAKKDNMLLWENKKKKEQTSEKLNLCAVLKTYLNKWKIENGPFKGLSASALSTFGLGNCRGDVLYTVGVQQHPKPRTTKCQKHPSPQSWQSKMSSDIAKCTQGQNHPHPQASETHCCKWERGWNTQIWLVISGPYLSQIQVFRVLCQHIKT